MVEFLWKSESRGYKIVQINSIHIQFYQFTLIFTVSGSVVMLTVLN